MERWKLALIQTGCAPKTAFPQKSCHDSVHLFAGAVQSERLEKEKGAW